MTSARKVLTGLALLDAASVFLAFNLVTQLRGLGNGSILVTPLLGPWLALVVAIALIDGYNPRTDMLSLDYASQHAIAVTCALLVMLLLTYAVIPAGYELQSSRVVITLGYFLLIPLTLAYRRIIHQRSSTARGARSLVFVGDETSYREFCDHCQAQGLNQRIIFITFGGESEETNAAGTPAAEQPMANVLGNIKNHDFPVEAIVLRETSQELPPPVSRQLVELFFAGVPTYTLELFHQVYWRKIPLYRLNQIWLFQEGFQIAREPVFERVKRAADIGFAVTGLVLGAPFILLGALAVWIEDRGPAFFSQTRIGKNHAAFRIYKLRTMHRGETGDLYTRPNDQRITRVGRLLRTTRIDELPQLWNVLHGEMSLIGPRAEWDRLVERYERDIPCYHFRHLVKPGITGWAQVNYPYGASLEDTLRKLEYDLYYIRHFSFLLDASIVLKTIHIMLLGKGR